MCSFSIEKFDQKILCGFPIFHHINCDIYVVILCVFRMFGFRPERNWHVSFALDSEPQTQKFWVEIMRRMQKTFYQRKEQSSPCQVGKGTFVVDR